MATTVPTLGIVGALRAFPRRLAARAVATRGGRLRRGITRQTQRVVLGRKLLDKASEAEIEARIDTLRDAGVKLISENGFLRWLHLLETPERSAMSRQSLLDQSRLDGDTLDRLALFDAFEHDSEPFSFRDLILAKKYAGLIAGGASWGAVARSVHRSGPVASLTALSLHPGGPQKIYAAEGDRKRELDGQRLLPLEPADDDSEEYFALAEQAEDAQALCRGDGALWPLPVARPVGLGGRLQPRQLLPRAGRGRRSGRRLRARHQDRPEFRRGLVQLRGAAARTKARSTRRAGILHTRHRDRPGLCRRGLQSRDARVRRAGISTRRAAGGAAISSSTRTANGRAPPRAASPSST